MTHGWGHSSSEHAAKFVSAIPVRTCQRVTLKEWELESSSAASPIFSSTTPVRFCRARQRQLVPVALTNRFATDKPFRKYANLKNVLVVEEHQATVAGGGFPAPNLRKDQW
jgi:hypothetical protein